MAVRYANAEAGVAPNAVTTADGWDTVITDTGSTITFNNTRIAHGSRSYRVLFTTGRAYLLWSAQFSGPTFGRFYLNRDAVSTVVGVLQLQDSTSGTDLVRLQMNPAGTLALTLNGPGTVVNGAAVLTTLTWYRVAWSYVPGPSGSVTATLYAGDSNTALDTITISGNTGAADTVAHGNTIPGVFGTSNLYYDDVAVSTISPPGVAPSGQETGGGSESTRTVYGKAGEAGAATEAASSVQLGGSQTKAAADTATVWEATSNRYGAAGESGTGAEAGSHTAPSTIPKTAADTVTGTEATSTRYVGAGATGAGTEAGTRTTNLAPTGTDTATGTDTGTRTDITTLAKAGADTATVIDAENETVNQGGGETAVAADAVTLTATALVTAGWGVDIGLVASGFGNAGFGVGGFGV